ncbi:BA75_02850T0 [Komagataella pastoris]|uniref:BA75_02850T0 n=1 Tax=Komagataella pastoris TaxID=4922 RepID=A0A1B2JC44_PICPA|nr:BA75_02850T0 [Komagataella pastoris]
MDPTNIDSFLSRLKPDLVRLKSLREILGTNPNDCQDEQTITNTIQNLISNTETIIKQINYELNVKLKNTAKIYNIIKNCQLSNTKEFVWNSDLITTKFIVDFNKKHNEHPHEEIDLRQLLAPNKTLYDLRDKIDLVYSEIQPEFLQQIQKFDSRLLIFYKLLDYLPCSKEFEEKYLSKLPSKQDTMMIQEKNGNLDMNTVDYIIEDTNFKHMSIPLLANLNFEIKTLIGNAINKIKDVFQNKLSKYMSTFEVLNGYSPDDSLIQNLLSIRSTILHDKLPEVSSLLKEDLSVSSLLIIQAFFNDSSISHLLLSDFKELECNLKLVLEEKDAREKKITKLKAQCESLWAKLDTEVDANYITEFLLSNNNIRQSSVENYQHELERLNELKLKNAAKFIQLLRQEIDSYWNLLMYTQKEKRNEFPEYFVSESSRLDEDLLNKHQLYISDNLNIKVEQLKPILNNVEKLKELVKEKRELEESCKDSSRLLSRDSFKILKREEQIRTRITKHIPLLLDVLKPQLENYKLEAGKSIIVDGVDVWETINELESKFYKNRIKRTPSRRLNKSAPSSSRSGDGNRRNSSTATTPTRNKVIRSNSTLGVFRTHHNTNGKLLNLKDSYKSKLPGSRQGPGPLRPININVNSRGGNRMGKPKNVSKVRKPQLVMSKNVNVFSSPERFKDQTPVYLSSEDELDTENKLPAWNMDLETF